MPRRRKSEQSEQPEDQPVKETAIAAADEAEDTGLPPAPVNKPQYEGGEPPIGEDGLQADTGPIEAPKPTTVAPEDAVSAEDVHDGAECEDQAWVNPRTSETRLFPTCSERWTPAQEAALNSGDWVPHQQWLQRHGKQFT